jgi:hypothetical protein
MNRSKGVSIQSVESLRDLGLSWRTASRRRRRRRRRRIRRKKKEEEEGRTTGQG